MSQETRAPAAKSMAKSTSIMMTPVPMSRSKRQSTTMSPVMTRWGRKPMEKSRTLSRFREREWAR